MHFRIENKINAFYLFLALVIWLATVQVLFRLALDSHSGVTQKAIESGVRHWSGAEDLDLAGQVSEFAYSGLIRCLTLSRAGMDPMVDFSFQGSCVPNPWLLDGQREKVRVIARDGRSWELTFTVLPPGGFLPALWITRISGFIVVLLSMYALLLRFRESQMQLRSEMERAQAIEQVARQLGHDIRSPLSLLKIVVSKYLDDKDVQNTANQALQRVDQIASDLLEKEHVLEAKPVQATIDLLSLIREIIKEKTHRYPEKSIQWKTSIDAKQVELSVSVSSLYRMISNLMQNSIEALNKQPQPFIMVETRLNENKLVLEIKDNGIGIGGDLQQRLMSENVSYGKEEGYGLGFSYVRSVVTKAGGLVEIDSQVGKGTNIKVYLPIQRNPV